MTQQNLNSVDFVETHAEPFVVIHPLDDTPEQKRNGSDLGLIKMGKGVKLVLCVLRIYLFLVIGLAGYRLVEVMIMHR